MTVHQPIGAVTRRALSFLNANAASPVVYGSVSPNGVVYRLADGRTFNLSRSDCKHAGHPHWAHHDAYYFETVQKVRVNKGYEDRLLKKLRREALLKSTERA